MLQLTYLKRILQRQLLEQIITNKSLFIQLSNMKDSIINQLKFVALAASILLMLIVLGCSSGDPKPTPPIPNGGEDNQVVIKVTRDTLVSYLRHYGKLNVCKRTLRQEIEINDTSKIKKLLGKYYPMYLDKFTDRYLKVPYDVYVEIGFDINEIANSIKEIEQGHFTASRPTPIVEITGIYVRFDQELRKIGLTRWDIGNDEFAAAWEAANIPELIKSQVEGKRKDEFIDAVVMNTVSSVLNSVRNQYQGIEFNFEQTEQTPKFSEIPTFKYEGDE